jgi:hypothetical protein
MVKRISNSPVATVSDPGGLRLLEDQRATLAAELAAARELYRTFDPDSPPWSAEPELRRLELRWSVLTADVHRRPPPGGASSTRGGKPLATAA